MSSGTIDQPSTGQDDRGEHKSSWSIQPRTNIVLSLALAGLREKASMSQYALADEMGVSQPWIAEIESGKRNLTLKTITRYVEACGFEIVIRVDGTGALQQLAVRRH